jgi:hypothetical protein
MSMTFAAPSTPCSREIEETRIVRPHRPVMLKRFPFGRPPDRSDPVIPTEAAGAYPALADDIRLLDEVVGPDFHRADRAALLHQYRYRRQQVLILLGSTLLAGLGGLQAVVPGQSWPNLLLFFLGSAVTWLSKTAGELKPLDDFFTERMKAERFRAMYFRFLSRTGRYAVAAPETVLRRAVLSVRNGEEPK